MGSVLTNILIRIRLRNPLTRTPHYGTIPGTARTTKNKTSRGRQDGCIWLTLVKQSRLVGRIGEQSGWESVNRPKTATCHVPRAEPGDRRILCGSIIHAGMYELECMHVVLLFLYICSCMLFSARYYVLLRIAPPIQDTGYVMYVFIRNMMLLKSNQHCKRI